MADIVYKGIALPTSSDKYPLFKEEKELIEDSIITILGTRIGQRFFVPDFGSLLWTAVFEPDDTVTAKLIDEYIRTALRTWEPRIDVVSIDVQLEPELNMIVVLLTYRIRRINEILTLPLDISRDNFSITIREAA